MRRIVHHLIAHPYMWGLALLFGLLGGSFALNPTHAAAVDCSGHFVTLNVTSYDAATHAGIGGMGIKESRGDSICRSGHWVNGNPVYGPYIDDSGSPGHQPNVGTTDGSGNLTLYDNCFTPIPYIQTSPPPGGSFDHAVIFDPGGFSYVINSGADFNAQFGPGAASNPNSDISKIWSGSTINEAQA